MERPKEHFTIKRWQQPYIWLTGAAIGILIFSLIITVGFVRGYLNTALIYFEWYSSGTSPAIPNTVIIISVSVIIPIIVSIAGATVLLAISPTRFAEIKAPEMSKMSEFISRVPTAAQIRRFPTRTRHTLAYFYH